MAACGRSSRAALSIARSSLAPDRRDAVRRAPEPNAPRAFPDLQLPETGRPELGDQRGQELLAEPVDGGVVRGTLLGRPLGGSVPRLRGFGHGLDLL
ncbi:MAG TPA: hypothetical protein VEV81_04195, partial [Pyrinomonadaceae bacterium]|nr:hypothetical protein [Pyrinomonadaceae bacterium]